jgi:hypothetical protein
MSRDIESIKKNYTGRKRYYLIKAAHRIYRYKSFYALRSSLGIVIQVPFFFAAYSVLSHYNGYAGVSLFLIKDLSLPDAILFGINLLPFLMTAVNLASAFYYTRSTSFKTNKELIIMSAVFLFLLYDSPSALLIYWTMNNVFSLVKTFIFRRLNILGYGEVSKTSEQVAAGPSYPMDSSMTLFLHALLFSLQVYWIVNHDETFKYCMLLTLLFSIAASALHALRLPSWRKTIIIAAYWVCLIPVFYLFYASRKYNPYISNTNLKLLLVFLLDVLPFVPSYITNMRKSTFQIRMPIYGLGVLLFASLSYVLLYQPLLYYLNAPSEIGVAFFPFLFTLTGIFVPVALFVGIVYTFLPSSLRGIVPRVLLFSLLVSVAWSMILRVDTGMLDGFSFQHDDAIKNISFIKYILDATLLALFWRISGWIIRTHCRTAYGICAAFLSIMIVHGVYKTATNDNLITLSPRGEDTTLPENLPNAHQFSTNGQNIVFVIADMFNGNYMGKILEQYPEYAEKLQGFTWYSDTLAVSYNTATSLPAMLGGGKYLPIKMNGNGKTGMEELSLAASSFFQEISAKGFDITVANPSYIQPECIPSQNIYDIRSFSDHWKKVNGIDLGAGNSDKSTLPVLLSILNSAPFHWKYIVYDDSSWIIYRKSALFTYMREKAIKDMAYLDLLPSLSSTGLHPGRFFYIHNELPHTPFGLNKAGDLVDGEFPNPEKRNFANTDAALYSAKKEIDLLINWFDWMKKNDVYNNTVICIVSDHGNPFNDADIPDGTLKDSLFSTYDLSRSNALMMIKGFGSMGPLTENQRGISSADTIGILDSHTGLSFSDSVFDPNVEKERIYSSIATDWEAYLGRDTVPFRSYRLRGPRSKQESWSILD